MRMSEVYLVMRSTGGIRIIVLIHIDIHLIIVMLMLMGCCAVKVTGE